MRPTEDINKIIKKLHLKASANLDKRVHDRISGAQAKPEYKQATYMPPNIWRNIMKNPITKLAAAAAIVIAVISISHYFTGSFSITTPAFSKIINNALSQKWVYMFEEDRKAGQIEAEYWYNPSQQKLYYKTKKDYAFVLDMVSGDEYEYRNNQITIKKMDDFEVYSGWIAERMPIISSLLNKYEKEGANIVQKQSMYNSQHALLYEIQLTLPERLGQRTYKYTWLVDKKTRLPIICENNVIYNQSHNETIQQTLIDSYRYAFDYPDSGPSDIYALGVPSDVNIVDERLDPNSDIQQLVNKINSIKETKYKSYAYISLKGDYLQKRVIRDGQRIRDEFLELKINGSDYVPNKEQHFQTMGKSFDSIDKWIDKAGIVLRQHIYICDGQFGYETSDWSVEKDDQIEISLHTGVPHERYNNSFLFFCWWDTPKGMLIKNVYSEENNLICAETSDRRYYYDPAKEYMCVRSETKGGTINYEIQEFGKTASGMLYPSTVREIYYSQAAGSDELIPHYQTIYIYAQDVNDVLIARLDPKSLPNYVDHRKLTLELAAQYAQQDGNDVEYTGFTPLHMAIYRQDIERVKALLEKGAEVEPAYDSGATPMELAVASGNLEMVKLLHNHGADFISNDSEQRDSLGLAVKEGFLEIAEFMLTHGSSVDDNYKNQDKPLKYAAANGDLEMLKMLLEYNPQIDPKDTEGRTPLYYAVAALRNEVEHPTPADEEIVQDIISLLIEHGANINIRDRDGQTPLLITISSFSASSKIDKRQLNLIRFLLKMGAEPDLMSDNASPLYTAAKNSFYDIVQILLEAGADPWQMPLHGDISQLHNLLHYARQTKKDQLYEMLYPYMKEKYERTNNELVELTKQVITACLESDKKTIDAICVDHPSYSHPWDNWLQKIKNSYEGHEELLENIVPGWFTEDGLAQTYIPLPEGATKKSILLGFIQFPDDQWKCIFYLEQNYMPVFEQPVSLNYDLQSGLDRFRNLMYENAGLPGKIMKKDSGSSISNGKFEGQIILTIQKDSLRIDFEEDNYWQKHHFMLTSDYIKMYVGNMLEVYTKEYTQKQKDYPQQLIYHPSELIIDTGQTKYIFTISDGQVMLTQGENRKKAELFIFDLDTWQLK
jgi:ankyrin repeat protein